jgi:HK97 gp10 family phage protein
VAEVVQVKGLLALQARMKQLPRELQGAALEFALRYGAAPIVAEAQLRAPQRTGRLASAIGVRTARDREHDAEVQIVPRGGKSGAFYWKFIEFGHRKRASKRRTRRQQKLPPAAGELVPARPFLRPAFEAQKEEALRRIVEALGAAVEAARAKVVRNIS